MRRIPRRRIPPPRWMRSAGLQSLFRVVGEAGGTARLVGGAVRAALLRTAPGDLDVATDLPPLVVMAALRRARIRVIPTGLQHGTVTALVGPLAVEITTLRVDVETDGRHARVAFTDDWRADAQRRDLTINALYADLDGTVHDPVGGLADLRARRVRFIGRAADRIDEDALRILRFFRLHAHFGAGAPDPAALAACSARAAALERISRERITIEFLKLLAAADPGPALRAMQAAGVAAQVWPAPMDVARCERLVAIERRHGAPDPLRRLAALLPRTHAAAAANLAALRLSNAQKRRLLAMAAKRGEFNDLQAIRRTVWLQGGELAMDLALLAAADGALADPAPALLVARTWWPTPFPLGGGDVLALGVAPGPRVAQLLDQARHWWADNGFAPDRAACLAWLRRVAAQ